MLKEFEDTLPPKGIEYCNKIKQSICFAVKSPVESFTGREKELCDLHNFSQRTPIAGGNTLFQNVTVVCGLSGVGKTQLIAKYVQKYRADFDHNIVWINAETNESIQTSFIRLAESKLGISLSVSGIKKDIMAIVNEVYNFFASKKSLFIFDNAEQMKTGDGIYGVYEFLPEENTTGHIPYIFVTSVSQNWPTRIMFKLSTLTEEDAAEFVKSKLYTEVYTDVDAQVSKLSKRLQYFPLALQQAVSYINAESLLLKCFNPKDQFTIEKYLQKLDTNSDLLNYKCENSTEEEKTTFTTWSTVINRLAERKNSGEEALHLLNIIAYYAPDKIPNNLLLHFMHNKSQLWNCIKLLERYFLVSSVDGYCAVHRLVQHVTRLKLKEKLLEEKVMMEAFQLLEQRHSPGHSPDVNIQNELLPHFAHFGTLVNKWMSEHPAEQSNIVTKCMLPLLWYIFDYYWNKGNTGKQIEYLKQRLKIQHKLYKTHNHFKIAKTLVNLANAYGDEGDHAEKERLLNEALIIIEEHYGANHFETARTLLNLSNTCGYLEEHERKKELLRKALSIVEQHPCASHFSNSCDDLEEGQKLLEMALLIEEKHCPSF